MIKLELRLTTRGHRVAIKTRYIEPRCWVQSAPARRFLGFLHATWSTRIVVCCWSDFFCHHWSSEWFRLCACMRTRKSTFSTCGVFMCFSIKGRLWMLFILDARQQVFMANLCWLNVKTYINVWTKQANIDIIRVSIFSMSLTEGFAKGQWRLSRNVTESDKQIRCSCAQQCSPGEAFDAKKMTHILQPPRDLNLQVGEHPVVKSSSFDSEPLVQRLQLYWVSLRQLFPP